MTKTRTKTEAGGNDAGKTAVRHGPSGNDASKMTPPARRRRVYVAGPYSGGNVLQVLKHIGTGQQACAQIFAHGMAPFCPWHDRTYVTDRPYAEFAVEDFRAASMAWLEVSEAVFLVGDWRKSKGTLAEIERAEALGIPVFENWVELVEWSRT